MTDKASENNSISDIIMNHALLGRVMAQATAVETLIDACIAEYYTHCPDGDYQNSYLTLTFDVLNHKGVTLSTKVDILFKVFSRVDLARVKPGDRKAFDDWLHVRNIFAHGKMIDGALLYNGKYYNIQDQANKHAELQVRINTVLDRFSNLRGRYFGNLPVTETDDA
ncbi:hypothetical protein GW930_02825 [Candidatus Saccharibacteria bacterium]|nr:hypothetical protein [Candidatus Saccharibacteria bacterium]